ncbi:orotidine-5'-phosphate decarboxylase [Tindallia magadiensis]|uniref:Orotidine 5'-phosphate decarboxylase n=1 Tax=Tindallia magadiensis TaxID=69895 RepID=A0A1I3DTT9_9FIRM|nr:orotidine-5'-phosphate decarboxylase [Tindallia magadiensis]SFH90063.1 orotidine-5'-phosphate decarboxylase [Tindallia magadiensis]
MKKMKNSDRLIVALDVNTVSEVHELTEKIGENVIWYKVGMELFYAEGPKVIELLKQKNKKIFLDLKFHDIPNTVAGAVKSVAKLGVDMCNVHASGGLEMMKRAADANLEVANQLQITPTKLIAVTVLTSIDQEIFEKELGFESRISDKVSAWAKMAKEAGLNGVVASAQEAEGIKGKCGDDFLIVTPGIRPSFSASNDQKRIMRPSDALAKGATHLVVGRPITQSENPARSAELVLKEMEG